MTTIYFIRHANKSKTKEFISHYSEHCNDVIRPISIAGIKQSQRISECLEFKNIDIIVCSHYLRSIMTALYLSESLNVPISIEKRVGERIRRMKLCDEMPVDFRLRQMLDENYKCKSGESRKEVTKRFANFVNSLLEKHEGKRIALFSHKTAITMYLMSVLQYFIDSNGVHLFFNGKEIFDGKWDGTAEIFCLEYERNEVVNAKKITI